MFRHLPATRRRFVGLLISVVGLHVLAIAAYYLFDMPRAPAGRQRIYVWVWMVCTVALVLVGLQRIRRARRDGRR